MAINYHVEAEKYRPITIRFLLVGEAPPSSGESYFYVPHPLKLGLSLEKDRSLPSTIFGHHFGRRPLDVKEYVTFLKKLKKRGIFLIDICDDPIRVRNCKAGVKRVIQEIRTLRVRMAARGIRTNDDDIIFLLARGTYLKNIKQEFPHSRYFRWKAFRTAIEEAPPKGLNNLRSTS